MNAISLPRSLTYAKKLYSLVVAMIATCMTAQAVFAATPLVTPNDMNAGSLLLKSSEQGKYIAAPAVASDYTVTISGPTGTESILPVA